ncbi:MAG: peroxiredoxin family protein [Terriglobales bacterium]
MFGFKPYNYEEFTKDVLIKDIALDKFSSPKPGDRAPDFEARTLEGEKVRLSYYRGEKNVVLTFGSVTCPFTASSIGGLNDLYEDYEGEDVAFLFCYVREAHPGERLPAHESMHEKVRAAELFRNEESVSIPIVVDDLSGSIHKKYGKLPNSTFLIDKSGRVAFRSLWTRPRILRDALDELLERQEERGVEHAVVHNGQDTFMPSAKAIIHTHRALQRGGRRAIREFRREMGTAGVLTVTGSRVVRPVAKVVEPVTENPGKTIAFAALGAGIVVGAVFLGRALRNRRLRQRVPYDIERLGMPRRTASSPGDYEAVGI